MPGFFQRLNWECHHVLMLAARRALKRGSCMTDTHDVLYALAKFTTCHGAKLLQKWNLRLKDLRYAINQYEHTSDNIILTLQSIPHTAQVNAAILYTLRNISHSENPSDGTDFLLHGLFEPSKYVVEDRLISIDNPALEILKDFGVTCSLINGLY